MMLQSALERLRKQIQGLQEEGLRVDPALTEEEVLETEQRLGLTYQQDFRRFLVAGMEARPLREYGFGLNPPLTVQEVRLFEERWGVTLPEEYRSFLTQLGNGESWDWQARSWIGLHPLEYAARQVEDKGEPVELAVPFPAPRTLEEAWRLGSRSCRPGSLPIGHEGSGIDTHLIVSGSERGNIWTGLQVAIPWPPPGSQPVGYGYRQWNEWAAELVSPANTYRVGFLAWYEMWLRNRARFPQWGFNLDTADRFSVEE